MAQRIQGRVKRRDSLEVKGGERLAFLVSFRGASEHEFTGGFFMRSSMKPYHFGITELLTKMTTVFCFKKVEV